MSTRRDFRPLYSSCFTVTQVRLPSRCSASTVLRSSSLNPRADSFALEMLAPLFGGNMRLSWQSLQPNANAFMVTDHILFPAPDVFSSDAVISPRTFRAEARG